MGGVLGHEAGSAGTLAGERFYGQLAGKGAGAPSFMRSFDLQLGRSPPWRGRGWDGSWSLRPPKLDAPGAMNLGAPASRRRVDVSRRSDTPAGRWRSQAVQG